MSLAASIEQDKRNDQNTTRSRTLAYFAAFIALGLCVALFGPTLSGLAANTGVTLGTISLIFVVNSVGRLFGSLLCGRLLDQNVGHLIVAGGFVLLTTGMALAPLASSLAVLMALFFVIGVGENLVDVATNTFLVWTHGARSGPWMNGLHFTFGVGGIAAPLLAAGLTTQTGSVRAVYWLVAAVMAPFVVWLLRVSSPTRLGTNQRAEDVGVNWKVVWLVAIFFFVLVGAEVNMLSWTFTFGLKSGFDAATGAAVLASGYWAAYSFGRLLSIPISLRVQPRIVLMADLAGALVGAGVLLLGGTSPVAVWVGVVVLGLSLASIFPTMLTFTGSLVSVTGKVNGVLFAASNIGAMFFPWFLGQLFEPLGASALPWSVIGVLLAAVAAFVAILVASRPARVL